MHTLIEPDVVWRSPEDPRALILSRIQWRSADPFAVSIQFRYSNEVREWIIGRDLFLEAFRFAGRQIGLGDVRVCVTMGQLWLTLSSPDGLHTLSTTAQRMAHFTNKIYEMVPYDQEGSHLGLDQVIRELLA